MLFVELFFKQNPVPHRLLKRDKKQMKTTSAITAWHSPVVALFAPS